MDEVGIYAAAVTGVILLFTGIMVGWPSYRKRTVPGLRYFVFLCVFLALWVWSNFLSDIDIEDSLFWVRLGYICIAIVMHCFLMFVNRFPQAHYGRKFEDTLHTTLLLGVLLITFTDLFIPAVVFHSNISNVVPGLLYPIFIIYVTYILSLSSYRLLKSWQRLKGQARQQVTYILRGTLAMAAVAFTTNLIMPLILGDNRFYWIGSMSTLLFVGAIGYSITKYRLFDVRRAVVRTVVYIIALATLVGFYTVTVLYGVTRVLVADPSDLKYQLLLIISAAVIGLAMSPLVKFFDRITTKVFFRNDIDPQKVLTELGAIIGKEAELHPFANHSLALIKNSIQAEFAVLVLQASNEKLAVFTKGTHRINKSIVESLKVQAPQVVLRQDAESNIQAIMKKSDIFLSIKLHTTQGWIGQIAIGGKKNERPYSDSDIRFLDVAADELGVALQNILRLDEIRSFNETLQDEVSKATHELRQTNKKLQDLDQSKDEFISMASHQLRTPLTTVKGYLSMVLEGDVGDVTPTQRKVLEEAFGSAQRMVYLISDFLNVSRLQTGKFELELSQADLPTILAQEVSLLQDTATSRQMTLDYQKPSHFPIVRLDENKIRQVIMNFIDNAVYYTRQGDTIQISLTQQGGEVVFKVVDHGIGVPANERHKLFAKFYRASNAKKQRPDGTGIGLFMSRKVVAAHGGSIIFESVENKGSTFGFRLPLSAYETKAKK